MRGKKLLKVSLGWVIRVLVEVGSSMLIPGNGLMAHVDESGRG